MRRNTGSKSVSNGSPLLTGILIGMVIGLGMAAGLAWFIMKTPSPYVQKQPAAAKPTIDGSKATVTAPVSPAAISGVADGKPRFEFYKVLTDKQDAPTVTEKPTEKQPPVKTQPVDGKPDSKLSLSQGTYFLQAGSYSSAEDAEKLKARLAMLGIESYIQVTTLADKGVWHRVRIGPYTNTEEMNRTRSLLKENGMDATPVHAP